MWILFMFYTFQVSWRFCIIVFKVWVLKLFLVAFVCYLYRNGDCILDFYRSSLSLTVFLCLLSALCYMLSVCLFQLSVCCLSVCSNCLSVRCLSVCSNCLSVRCLSVWLSALCMSDCLPLLNFDGMDCLSLF